MSTLANLHIHHFTCLSLVRKYPSWGIRHCEIWSPHSATSHGKWSPCLTETLTVPSAPGSWLPLCSASTGVMAGSMSVYVWLISFNVTFSRFTWAVTNDRIPFHLEVCQWVHEQHFVIHSYADGHWLWWTVLQYITRGYNSFGCRPTSGIAGPPSNPF